MIRTVAELRAWLDEQSSRHQKASDTACSCGQDWTGDPLHGGRRWEQHAAEIPISDLGDVLPSDTWDKGGPQAWRTESEWLWGALDRAHGELDFAMDVLLEIVRGDGSTNPRPLAASALARIAPDGIWVECAREYLPDIDLSLTDRLAETGGLSEDRSSSGE